jgi:predicted naringenin-chalcone synthase
MSDLSPDDVARLTFMAVTGYAYSTPGRELLRDLGLVGTEVDTARMRVTLKGWHAALDAVEAQWRTAYVQARQAGSNHLQAISASADDWNDMMRVISNGWI